MARRILPLLLVFAVSGGPIAAEVCEMTCASPVEHAGMPHSAMHHATDASGQSCHEVSTTSGPRMAAMPHPCGHDAEGQPAASLNATQNGTTAIPLAFVSASPAALDASPSLIFNLSPHSRSLTYPTSVRSVMPLRI